MRGGRERHERKGRGGEEREERREGEREREGREKGREREGEREGGIECVDLHLRTAHQSENTPRNTTKLVY